MIATRPLRRRTTRAVAIAVLALLAAPASSAACPGAGTVPTADGVDAARGAVLCLLNHERARHGLRPLRRNGDLRQAAGRHSRDMASRNYFSHVSPGGSDQVDRIRAAGYLRGARRWTAGENIAWGTGGQATPASIVAAWMASPGHRANLLRPGFRHVGIGIAAGVPVSSARTGATYTTNFGAN